MTIEAGSTQGSSYIPALHYRRLTPLYDPVLRWAFREEPLKRQLVRLADLQPGQRVLDLGSGTGTLTILLKRSQPKATVIGLDGDVDVLRIAKKKATAAHIDIGWDWGVAGEMPYPDGFFDAVLTCLVLHHLTAAERGRALREAARVLRPGGLFLAADFGPPQSRWARVLAKVSEMLEETRDGVEGRLPGMFERAGLGEATVEGRGLLTPMGTVVTFRSHRP